MPQKAKQISNSEEALRTSRRRRKPFSLGRRKITFIGASYKFVHKVVRDMMISGEFNEVELALHDIDKVPLTIVGDLIEKSIRQKGSGIKVTRTLDRGKALKDAEAVILSITVGGKEADFRSWEVCSNYGIPTGVGDTLGPPALARNLRTIPVVLEIMRDMEELCPNAAMLNFTNPMSCVTGAMARRRSLPAWGLCHSCDELYEYFSKLFCVPQKDVEIELGGVNHQSFVTRLKIKGRDLTSQILAKADAASSLQLKDSLLNKSESTRLQRDICRILGVWPSTSGLHLSEFYRFFHTPRRNEELGLAHHFRRLIPGRPPFGRTECPEIIKTWAHGPKPVEDLDKMTSEHAHELLSSWLSGTPCTRSLNTLNSRQSVAGIPEDACVEVMATVRGNKVTTVPVSLPKAAHALVATWTAIHDLSIKASVECDRDAACQALFLDPHVGDIYDIPPLLNDMLTALEPWLPKKWLKK